MEPGTKTKQFSAGVSFERGSRSLLGGGVIGCRKLLPTSIDRKRLGIYRLPREMEAQGKSWKVI